MESALYYKIQNTSVAFQLVAEYLPQRYMAESEFEPYHKLEIDALAGLVALMNIRSMSNRLPTDYLVENIGRYSWDKVRKSIFQRLQRRARLDPLAYAFTQGRKKRLSSERLDDLRVRSRLDHYRSHDHPGHATIPNPQTVEMLYDNEMLHPAWEQYTDLITLDWDASGYGYSCNVRFAKCIEEESAERKKQLWQTCYQVMDECLLVPQCFYWKISDECYLLEFLREAIGIVSHYFECRLFPDHTGIDAVEHFPRNYNPFHLDMLNHLVSPENHDEYSQGYLRGFQIILPEENPYYQEWITRQQREVSYQPQYNIEKFQGDS